MAAATTHVVTTRGKLHQRIRLNPPMCFELKLSEFKILEKALVDHIRIIVNLTADQQRKMTTILRILLSAEPFFDGSVFPADHIFCVLPQRSVVADTTIAVYPILLEFFDTGETTVEWRQGH